MIEPEVTAGLGRRYMAFLIDSALVAATGLGVAFQQSTAFAVVGRGPDDKPLVDPAQFEAVEALLDFELLGQSDVLGLSVVRLQEIGDSVRVFGASSYRSGLIAAAIVAVIVFGLIPALLQRTLGMMPFGLGIKKTDGTPAGIGAHVTRTIVGVIDAFPFVIPGVLGFLAAGASRHHQRLGDRIARTAVVDLEAHRLGEITTDPINLGLVAAEVPDEQDPVVSNSVPSNPFVATEPEQPSLAETIASTSLADTSPVSSGPTPVESLDAAQAAATAASAPRIDADDAEPDQGATSSRSGTSDNTKPPVAKPTFGDPLPPPPVHRKPPTEHPLGTHSNTVDDGADDEAPSPDLAGGSIGAEQDTAVDSIDQTFETASQIDAPTATVTDNVAPLRELPLEVDAPDPAEVAETPDEAWQPPREEPAPVWQPAKLETAPIEAPNPHDGRTLDDVVLREPSVGALISGAPTDDDLLASSTDRAGKHSQSTPTAKAPVWSDKWRAWMYWDTTKKCWLRHDTTSNTWQPID